MKLIKAYIRQDMFETVHRALNKEGYTSMTVMEAEGMGSYSDPEKRHGSLKFPTLHSKMVKLEMVSEADHAEALRKQFGVAGVRTIIFLDDEGDEVRESRIVGFVDAGGFLKRMPEQL